MATVEPVTFGDMFRAAPVRSALLTLLPLSIAVFQLVNSVYNDLSFAISIPFALVIVSFAYVLTQYSLARFRRQQRERLLWN